jgi:hypothetical protein
MHFLCLRRLPGINVRTELISLPHTGADHARYSTTEDIVAHSLTFDKYYQS